MAVRAHLFLSRPPRICLCRQRKGGRRFKLTFGVRQHRLHVSKVVEPNEVRNHRYADLRVRQDAVLVVGVCPTVASWACKPLIR
jgi:hypothetical protein